MRRFLISILLASPVVCYADTTVKTHTVITDTGSPPNVQSRSELRKVYYRKGSMRRRDGIPASISNIANCDTRTGYLIDLNAREYRNYKVVKFWSTANIEDYLQKHPEDTVQVESKTIDTGERKMFFGHLAKHFITTTTRAPDKNNAGGEETIDAWYIDHEPPDQDCAPDYVRTEPFYVVGTALVMPPQIARLHHIGPTPSGLAVERTLTQKTAGSRGLADRIITSQETVEELSDATLDPSLFNLPQGLHENPHLFGAK